MTNDNNLTGNRYLDVSRIFRKLATERAQAEEMEIKEMDPNGNVIIATEEGVVDSNNISEDSLYFDDTHEEDFSWVDEEVEKPMKMNGAPIGFNSPFFNQTFNDALFDGIKGIIQTFTGMNSGEVMRSQQTIDELNFMDKALDIEEQFKAVDKQLDEAYLANDTEAVRKLYPQRKSLFEAYSEILPDLNKAKRKYWEEVTNTSDKKKALENYRNELLQDNVVATEDMERWNNVQNVINQNIHAVSQEWEEGKEGDSGLLYQLPNALGTSASSLGVSIGTGVAAGVANAVAASPALSAGPSGATIVGSAAAIGLAASIAGTIWSRNQESLSEVSNNYTTAIQQYAQKHNIDTSEIIAEGRRKLQEITGSYSDDPNSLEYRDDSQVITGMLTYGIEFDDLELDKAAKISRRRLEDVYNRNMMLAASDVALNFVMLPAVGKFLNKAASLGVDDVLSKTATKTIDDIITYTSAKVARSTAESVATRSSKYIVDPIVRIGYTGLSEGFEELSQYMFGKQMDPDVAQYTENKGDYKFYNPIDFLSVTAENAGMLFKGIEGLMGISSDKALNNDKELATNFKIGALVGMLMGGGSQLMSGDVRKQFNSYNKGWNIARNLVKDHVNAREAMFRYTLYAEKALGGVIDWNTFSEGFDQALASQELPDTWTREELEKEKAIAKNIFDMAQSIDAIQNIPQEHQAFALAYLQYQQDRFNETKNAAIVENSEFIKNLNEAAKNYCQLHGIDAINAPIIAEYFRLKEGKDSLKKYEDSWMWLKGQSEYTADKEKTNNKIIELAETRKAMEDELYRVEQQLKNTNLYDLVTKHNSLTSVNDQIASNAVSNVLQLIAIKDIQSDVRRILNDEKALKAAVAKYAQSIKDNQEIEERSRQVEDENTDAAIEELNNTEVEAIEEVDGTGVSIEESPALNVTTPSLNIETIPEEKEEEKQEVSVADQMAQLLIDAEQARYEEQEREEVVDYDSTDIDEELTEEILDNDPSAISELFEERVLEESQRTREEVNALRDENDKLKQSLADLEARFSELERRVQESKLSSPHVVTEHPEHISITPDAEDIALQTQLENNELVGEPSGDATLFYNPTSTTPMMSGYESGEALNQYLSTPGAIQSSDYQAWVGDKDSPYGTYDPNDRNTWDNAAVYVEISAPDGKRYITALKTIGGAREQALRKGEDFTVQQEQELRNMRNTIIAAKLANPEAEVFFEEIRMSSGLLNNQRDSEGRAIQRKLTEIKGLHLPADLHELLDPTHGIRFGIGKGVKGKFIIVDEHDNVLPGIGDSGAIYIYPAASSTIDGVSRPIQLTAKRFKYTTGATNSFAYQIAKALIFGQTSIDGIPIKDLLDVMLNYGTKTLLKENDIRNAFMGNKQFNFDYSTGIVTLGEELKPIESLRNNDGIELVAKFIADNLHWNTEKLIMWNKLPQSFKNYLNRKGLEKASLFNGELEFDKEDLTLSGIAYLVKRGYLTSDLADQIYTSPFVYVAKPKVFIPKTYQVVYETESQPIGTDNNVLNAALQAEQELLNDTSNPYTDPNSDEVSDFFGDLDGAPKTVTPELLGKPTRKINEKQARKWLTHKLGLSEDEVEVVDGVIRTLSNGKAVMGVAKADGIMLSSEAAYGVEYHEAWHRVSLLMLTPEQRQRLYKEFKKANPKYRHASDAVIEETIADQFMDYMVANDKEGLKYFATKLFRKFKHFIGINANVDHYSLQEMFKAVRYGEMAKYKLDEQSLNEFRQAYAHGANYTIGPNKNVVLASINSPYEYQQLLNSIKSIIVVSNGLKYISQIQDLNPERAKQFLINRMLSPKLTTEQKEVLGEVINNFDTIMEDLRPIMEKMGIREIDEQQDSDFAERETTGIQHYDKAAYEFNKKENALGSAKIFLSTIPDTHYVYKDGVRSEPVPRISSLTGLPLIVDYDTAYAKVLRYLSSVETFAPTNPNEDPNLSILGKCKMLGEFDPFFEMLYKRLLNVDINTETQLLQTIKSFNQNFQEINYKTDKQGNTSFTLSDSINRRAIQAKPAQWSEMFFNSRFVRHENDKTTLDAGALLAMKDRFNNLHHVVMSNRNSMNDQQFNEYLTILIGLFNELGITVDRSVFDLMLGGMNRKETFIRLMDNRSTGSTYNFFNNQLDAIANNKTIKSKDGTIRPRQLNEVFVTKMNNIVNVLANYDVLAHPAENEISVLGPNNSVIFTKTLNNFVSDQIRWLNNNDPLVMGDFKNDPYCHSSLIYNTVKEGGKIRLNTFVNFYGLNKTDKGRDYVSISPVEDYIAKMVFTWNNHIIFPTMADKKTWYTISGCSLYNQPYQLIPVQDGRIKVEFDVNALDHVYNEWLDEYNTIVEYYNTLPSVTHYINNYHTKGKGGLFRHHTGYYKSVNGELKWVDLNKRIQEAIKYGQKHDKSFNVTNHRGEFSAIRQVLEEIKEELFTNKEATYQKINDNLAKERQAEIKKCLELGIIESKDGRLVNKLLDADVLKHFKTIYEQSAYPQVRAFAEHFAIITMIGNHMLNTNISVEETEKMFTGDPAFFKNNDDKIKRLGAVLSTGDNLRTQWMAASLSKPARTQEDKQSTSKTWVERDRLLNRQTYTSTVINDNMIQSQQYDLLKEMFTLYYIRQLLVERGLTEAEVDALTDDKIKAEYSDVYQMARVLGEDDASAYGLYNGKGAINQADAAVYISPTMYRNIVQMLGEWNDEIAEAYDIMESGIDWLNDRAKCAKAMKALIKPLKTTYFCNQYDDNIRHTVPVFDKMAMFPLFRVVATGDNKELYDRMNGIGKYEGMQKIDQIAFESAKKVGIISPSDVYTDYTNTAMNDLSNMHVVTQRFRNLRRQLITDPHTHDRTLFGTQVSTVAVSNLVLDRVYQQGTPNEKTGELIVTHLFGTINAISNNGIVEATKIYLNENGEVDLIKTSNELVKKAHSQNMGKDVEDALRLNETKDDFKIPLSALPDSKWVETALISDINKKAVDLELPGGAFIQMSSFGIKQINVTSASRNEYKVNNGKPLVNMNEDGSMDAIISINLLKHIIPGYKHMSFMEARQWLIDNRIIGENAEPAALGYRIPTQGLSSIAGIRISDVLPPVVGDTIILPDEFTAQTGSDFDIDKLYIARYNYESVEQDITEEFESWYRSQSVLMAKDERGKQQYTNRFENRDAALNTFLKENKAQQKDGRIIKKTVRIIPFDHSKGYEGNSREANENLLLRTYLDVLTDKKNVGETRLPLDKTTGIIKDEILPIVDGPAKKLELVPYKELSPSYLMDKKYEYNGGKAGIGPFALNNKNHILTQLVGLKFKEHPLLTKLGFLGLHGMNSRDENVIVRDKYGRKQKNPDGTYKYRLDKGVRILDWLSAMINAHVDVAKDPYVIRLNVCQYTYNLCNFLLRTGYGKSTFFFLPQPIFKEMSAAYDNASGNYGVDATKSKTAVVNEAIKGIRKKYADEVNRLSEKLNKRVTVEVGKYGVDFYVTSVTKDEAGNDVEKKSRMSWEDHATKLINRDFLIDQLQLSQQEQMTDEEAYEYNLNQLRLSMLFERLNGMAEDMSKLVQLSLIDTKKYGNNFVEQDRFIYRWKAFLVNTTLFEADDVFDYYTNTFLYTKLINGIVTPQAIFENMLLRSRRPFLDSITKVLMLTIGLEHNDEALNKTIANELEASIRNQFLNGKINVREMFYGENTMAKRLNKIKSDILSGKYPKYRTQDGRITNGLLNHLDILSKLYTDKYDAPLIIVRRGVGENDKNLNNLLKEYWSELLNSEYSEIKQFAQDLVTYMLLTTGGNHTKNGIFNLVPVDYIIDSGYGLFMKHRTENFISSDIDFDAFFLNNWHNDKLVKEIKLTETVYDQLGATEKDKFPIVRFTAADGRRIPVVLNPSITSRNQNADKDAVFQPFIKVKNGYDNNPANTLVYKFVGVNLANQTPVYVLVNKLGLNQNGRVIKEYHSGNTTVSEFDFNNHLFANVDIFGDVSQYDMIDADKVFLQRLIDDTVPVTDYLPVTQALRQNLIPNIRKQQLVQQESVESASQFEETIETIEAVEVVEQPSENTYTFPNGLVVNTGFKLNDQQIHALDVLSDFVIDPTKYNGKITLQGYAGTGKTTIIKFLHKYLNSIGLNPIYSAPTHRANAVTKQNNPNATVATLHSIFGLLPQIDLTKETLNLKNLKTVLVKDFSEFEYDGVILIVDESSMIDDTLYDFLMLFKERLGGIIFIGDDAQLSPVQNKDGEISKVFKEGQNNLQLTKVERTGDNPILKECTNLRNTLPFTYQTHVVNNEGVVYFNAQDETNDATVLNTINNVLNSKAFKEDPLHFRILCGTNRLVSSMNIAARKALFGNENLPIQIGEILMGYKNQMVGRNGQLNNSFDYVVIDASPEQTMTVQTQFGSVSYKGQYITIQSLFDTDSAPLTVKVVSNNNSDAIFDKFAEINKNYLQQVRMLFADKTKLLQARKLYAEWKSFQNSVITMLDWYEGDRMTLQKALDFGYSHTIHKSQGGTYSSVMIMDNSIANTQFDDLTKQQLRYVAMSRAKHNVWVVTNKSLGEEIKPTIKSKLTKTKTDVTRAQAIKTPKTLYIFTDNTNRTSGKVTIDPDSWYSQKYKTSVPLKYPSVTSARLRGLDNARPISTQHWYDPATGKTKERGRWNDSDFAEFKKVIDEEIQDIKEAWDSGKYDNVVIATPAGILRTAQNAGISGMSEDRVPKLFKYLLYKMKELDAYINSRQFDETYEEKQQSDDLVITGSAANTATKAKEIGGIDTLRHPDSNGMHFGNPFSHNNYQGVLKVVPTVKDAVIAFEQWLRGEAHQEVEPERRQWIVNQINNGSLKGKPIVYYTNTVPDNSYGVTEYNAQTAPNHAHILQKLINEGNIQNQSTANPSEFTNHSGGAYGGDTMWDTIGRKYGVQDHRHYRDAADTKMARGLKNQGVQATIVTKEQMDYARQQIKKILGKEYPDTIEGNKQVRNYYQAANADSIFAIGKLNDNKKSISGGTNTAVQLGIKMNKPVFVWDIVTEQWYKYDGKQFSPSKTPTLTKNFAGVGTRDIENYNVYDENLKAWVPREQFVGQEKAQKAWKAIDDVYKKTFGEGVKKQVVQLDLFQHNTTPINVYSTDNNGYRELSNFEVRPFKMKNKTTGTDIEFKSVEQAFQYTKVMYFANNQAAAEEMLRPTISSWEIKKLGATTPMTSEQIARWNKVSTDLMYRLMKTSFIQNESAKELLLSTGDAILTHKNERGQEQDGGRFSKLLMQIRDEIRQTEQDSRLIEELKEEHNEKCNR